MPSQHIYLSGHAGTAMRSALLEEKVGQMFADRSATTTALHEIGHLILHRSRQAARGRAILENGNVDAVAVALNLCRKGQTCSPY